MAQRDGDPDGDPQAVADSVPDDAARREPAAGDAALGRAGLRGVGEEARTDERPAAAHRHRPTVWSLRVGRIAGVPIRVHVTFWLLVVYLAWIAHASGADAFSQVVLVLAVFACIVLHEMAHVLVARRFGIVTRDVTLYPIGGVSRLERMGEPRQELAIALAGPLASLAIGGLLWAGLVASGVGLRWGLLLDGSGSFLEWLAASNFVIGVFNLLPALPSDGGRVLRALLALRLGPDRATSIAGTVGQAFALALGAFGFLTGALLLMLIAVFLFFGAQAEVALQSVLSAARGHFARDAMVTRFEGLRPEDPIGVAVEHLLRTEQGVFPVLEDGVRLVGLVTPSAIVEAVSNANGKAPDVRSAMEPAGEVVEPDADLGDVAGRLARDERRRPVAVVDAGRLVGLITWPNLMEWLAVTRAGG